jgi:hypothetical protein
MAARTEVTGFVRTIAAMPRVRRGAFYVLAALSGGLLAGCGSSPTAKQAAPPSADASFDDRVFAAQSVLEAKGTSTTDAKVEATQQVTREIAAAERLQHLKDVKPLTRALEDIERVRGAWKYTATTSTTVNGRKTVIVETFDPSQPDALLWNLESIDGKIPSPTEQQSYRRLKLAQWKRSQEDAPTKPESKQLSQRAVFDFFTITPSPDGKTREYAFVTAPSKIGPKFSSGQFRDAFIYDPASKRLVRRESVLLYRVGVVGGVGVDSFQASAEYGEFGTGRFAFVSRTTTRMHLHANGQDQGDRTIEVVYSGYHPVEPFASRRFTAVGIPRLADSLPGVF